MVSMFVGLIVSRLSNLGRAVEFKAEITRLAGALQRLQRDSECKTGERTEKHNRQKRRFSRVVQNQQLRLGTKSRAMRDNLTSLHQRSLTRAKNQANGLRKKLRIAKSATIDHNECHGLIAQVRWQYNQSRLIIVKQSGTIMRNEARIDFLQGRVDNMLLRRFPRDYPAYEHENNHRFRMEQMTLMNAVNGVSVERMIDTFKEESALILMQMVRLEDRNDQLSRDNHILQAQWQHVSTLTIPRRTSEPPLRSQISSYDDETVLGLVDQLSVRDEELRQARADLDARADHRPQPLSPDLEKNEEIEQLSIDNFNIQEKNRQLNSELCVTKVKLGRVTRCLQDALLRDRPETMSETHTLSDTEMLGDGSKLTTPTEPWTKTASRPARRSSVSRMEHLQDTRTRPHIPLRRRSFSVAIPVSGADSHPSISSSAQSVSLQDIVTMLRLVHGNSPSQPGDADIHDHKDDGEEARSATSQGGDGLRFEGDQTRAPYYGQRPAVLKGKTNRRRRKAKVSTHEEAADT